MLKGLLRSKLFVPGARPELFAKALAGDADAISFDLEDSVPESGKADGREVVAAFLRSSAARDARPLLMVRVNARDTLHFEADLRAIALPGVAVINLPKCASADDVIAAATILEAAEAESGLRTPIKLLANIETPAGLRHAAAIATAHPRVIGLQLGLADLFEPFAIERRDEANVHAVMFAVRLAAAEAGVLALDAAFADVRDVEGYRREAAMARRLGYVGKSCIHPSQVGIANDVFGASADELAFASRVVEAAKEARVRGHGAFRVDGRMIDAPFLARAEALLNAGRAA